MTINRLTSLICFRLNISGVSCIAPGFFYVVFSGCVAVFLLMGYSGYSHGVETETIEKGDLPASLASQGWVLLTRAGTAPTVFSEVVVDVGKSSPSEKAIQVVADNSNALIYLEVPEADQQKRFLEWQWQVREATAITDITQRPGDDRPLAVYAAFDVDSRYLGWWSRFKNAVLLPVLGIPLRGKVLTYTWGGTDPRGVLFANPYIADIGQVKILRSGRAATGQWFSETVDLMADFEMAFGHPAKGVKVLAVSADSEDTGQRSEALIKNVVFR